MINELKQTILNALKNNNRSTYQKAVYAFTNECVDEYLKNVKGNSALSICSSGDQYLNLIGYNFKNIKLIDINDLTEYYVLGIKQALILGFSFEDYQKITSLLFKRNHKDLKLEEKILTYILKFMPLKYQIFWQEIFSYYLKLQAIYERDLTIMQIITQDYYFDLDEITYYNNYLKSKEMYNYIKDNLLKTSVSFTLGNILDYKSDEKYDLILCSNVLEYLYLPNLNITKLKKVYEPLQAQLTENGQLYAAYIYGLYQDNEIRSFPIGGIDITGRELLKENILLVPSFKGEDKNGVLILKKY